MSFETWLRTLENYLLVIDEEGAEWPDARKWAVLLRNWSTEKVNVIAERRKFQQCVHRHDETIAQYVSTLRDMLPLSEFGNADKDMLWD